MIGKTRNLDEPSAFAAALDSAVGRLKSLLHKVQDAAQAHLNFTRAAPHDSNTGAPVIPTVRYRDVPAAIKWLCRAFGMKVHRVVTDATGRPCYAELTIGSGMLMVAPIEDTAFGKLMVQPDEIGGVETQVCYLCVTNARTHYARAKAAGAVIVLDIEDEANRGRGYSCRDPEGHVWNFGSYNPWERQQQPGPASQRWSLRRAQQGLTALVLLALATVFFSEVVPQPSARAGTAVPDVDARASGVERPPGPGGAAAKAMAVHDIEVHRAARAAAERTAAAARAQLADARGALERVEQEAVAARTQLEEMHRAKLAADRAALEAREHLATAQRTVERSRAEAALERTKRLAAEHVAKRRRASIRWVRPRARSWCYHPNAPNPASNGAARLSGFCRT